MDNQQSADLVLASIGEMSVSDPSSLINMLKVSGYNASSSMNQDQLLDTSMKALKDSNKFKSMLTSYLQSKIGSSSFSGSQDSYFANAGGKWDWLVDIGKDTAGKAVGVGVNYASVKLNANASKGSEQRAIELERERTKQLQASLDIAKTQASSGGGSASSPTSGGAKATPKWVMPLVIGGIVVVLGVVIYYAVKKKK